MKMFRASAAFLSTIAVSASFVVTSQAQAVPSQIDDPNEGNDANFTFEMSCDRDSISYTSLPEWTAPSTSALLPWFRPSCMLMGDQDGAKYLCNCEDDDAAVLGQLSREDIFPDGQLPPDAGPGAEGPSVSRFVAKACRELFDKHCGPFPEDLKLGCEDSDGACEVFARGYGQAGEYSEITAECGCHAGFGWSSQATSSQSRSFTREDASALCDAELRGCGASATPGPTAIELFPESDLRMRGTICARIDAEQESVSLCKVANTGTRVLYDCLCAHPDLVDEGSKVVEAWPNRAELFAQCNEILTRECQVSPDGSDEDPGIQDIFDQLGCNAGALGPLSPWLMPVWSLCLLALRRRD